MERTGEITSINGKNLQVTFCRPSDCEKCGACEGGKKQTVMNVKLTDKFITPEVGDLAVVSMPSKTVISASAIAYAVPLVCLVAGIVLGMLMPVKNKELAGVIFGFVGLAVSLVIIKLTERKRAENPNWEPVLVDIINTKGEK